MKRALLPWLCLLACGCGGNSPTGPTNSTGQEVANVSGVWSYSATLANIVGGECFASTLQSSVGVVERGTLSITQVGATLSGTTRVSSDGSSCSFTGTAGTGAIALSGTACTASDSIGATCPNGAKRDLKLQTLGINGNVTGNSLSGTRALTYNILVSGTSQPVGTLVLNGSFNATK